MFIYEKKLQFPVNIKNVNPRLASVILSQYGGPDGELGASLRYLSQRYSMPYPELKGLLTDIGTEGLVLHTFPEQRPISWAGAQAAAPRGDPGRRSSDPGWFCKTPRCPFPR